jgi:hypothetical protein
MRKHRTRNLEIPGLVLTHHPGMTTSDCFATLLHHRADDGACPTISRHTPRKRGIQYAAASRFHRNCSGILDRPLSRTMTAGIQISNSGIPCRHGFAISPRIHASFALNVLPSAIRGRRECRAHDAPAASRAERKKAHERSHHGHTGNRPAFPAQWFYGLLRALPGDQACLTPSPALLIADLTPASGRQNDTTWPYVAGRVRLARCRVHRIPPRVDDVAQRPSGGRDAQDLEVIWVRWQAKFLNFRN